MDEDRSLEPWEPIKIDIPEEEEKEEPSFPGGEEETYNRNWDEELNKEKREYQDGSDERTRQAWDAYQKELEKSARDREEYSRIEEENKRIEEERSKRAKFVRGLQKKEDKISDLEYKLKKEELKANRRKFKKQNRPNIPKTAGRIRDVLTLGGVPKVNKSTKDIYVPKVSRSLYDPTSSASLKAASRPETGLDSPLGRSVSTNLTSLKRYSAPPSSRRIEAPKTVFGFGEVGSSLMRLREASKIPLNRVEGAALEEIRANGDRDTINNVLRDLAELGYPRKEAEKAVVSLLEKGIVKKVYDGKGEEPILEVK